jgi:hypothetical protein
MKINKKVLIPVFATALGLSIIGGISGTVAWYQYNSKVTASYIGVSTADTGVLRIKEGSAGSWTRAVDKGSSNTLKPVTFEKDANGKFDTTKGWTTPEAGAGNELGHGSYYLGKDYVPASGTAAEEKGYTGWIQAGATDFAQFDLYFDAYQVNPDQDSEGYTHVARPVFLSNYILRSLDSNDQVISTKLAEDAIRVEFDIFDESEQLISQIVTGKAASTTALCGALDLDGSGTADKYHATPWNDVPEALNGEPIEYGIHGANQTVTELGSYNSVGAPLFTTIASDTVSRHVRISIWLEGWALLNSAPRAEWNPFQTAGCKVQVGLEFTTGEFRDTDLTNLTPVTPQP